MPSQKARFRTQIALGFAFSLYNALLGFAYASAFYAATAVYYALLLTVKAILWGYREKAPCQKTQRRVFWITASLTFLMSLALVFPIVAMLRYERRVTSALTVAIGIAAYTTYKVSAATVSFVKARHTTDPLLKETVTLGVIESVVSVLTLQNTLITVNGGMGDESMRVLSCVTSAAGFLLILYLILSLMIRHGKNFSARP